MIKWFGVWSLVFDCVCVCVCVCVYVYKKSMGTGGTEVLYINGAVN
jgi:hypothetical protein